MQDVEVVFEDHVRRYMLYFINPSTISMYFSSGQIEKWYATFYTEKNLVIIPEITMACIEAAVNKMTEELRFEELLLQKN